MGSGSHQIPVRPWHRLLDGHDHLAPGVFSLLVADGSADLIEWIFPVDHRSDLFSPKQFGQDRQIRLIDIAEEGHHLLVHKL